MDTARPSTWSAPSEWHPDFDADWEIGMLRRLAERVTAHDPSIGTRLDVSDPTVIHVQLMRGDVPFGEAYVNRQTRGSEAPAYVIYIGVDECHATTVDAAVAIIAQAGGR